MFREHFARLQWIGLAVLIAGVAVFVTARFGGGSLASRDLAPGMAMIGFAAATWAIYGLAQKQLLHTFRSNHVLLCSSTRAARSRSRRSRRRPRSRSSTPHAPRCSRSARSTPWSAYGAFAESLAHWEASRVGAVLALTPLGTLACATALDAIAPAWATAPQLSLGAWLGALLVVAGSLATSLGSERVRRSGG